MKNVKYKLIDMSIYDYHWFQSMLSDMAEQGWHLEKASAPAWKFRRGEPKAVRYEVTYSPAASAFNAKPTEAEEDLADLCAQAGWVHVTSAAQMQIFRNEDVNATPLETDEGQRLSNIRRTMKKHFFPPYMLMTVLFLLQFLMHGSTVLRYPSRTLSSPLMVSTLTTLPLVSLMYLILIFDGLRWLRKAQNAVDSGRAIPANTFYRRFRWVMWAGLGLYLWMLLMLAGTHYLALILSITLVSVGCTYGTISLCKKCGAPKWVTIIVPTLATAIAMMLVMTQFTLHMDRISTQTEPPQTEELPLMLTDLGDFQNTEGILLEQSDSIFVSYSRFHDDGGEEGRISCTIVDVKWEAFYDMCLNEQEKQFLQSVAYLTGVSESIAEQSALWDAEYVRHAVSANRDRWLICWEGRIVTLGSSWPLTEEQITIAAELLKP